MTSFSGTTIVASYAQNAARMVPGLRGLPKMARALLAERVSTFIIVLKVADGGLASRNVSIQAVLDGANPPSPKSPPPAWQPHPDAAATAARSRRRG